MKKILLMFTLALCIIFSACTFLCAAPTVDYSIYKVTKIGLSYTGAATPEVEITLSEVFDFQQGVSLPANFASDKVRLGMFPELKLELQDYLQHVGKNNPVFFHDTFRIIRQMLLCPFLLFL